MNINSLIFLLINLISKKFLLNSSNINSYSNNGLTINYLIFHNINRRIKKLL